MLFRDLSENSEVKFFCKLFANSKFGFGPFKEGKPGTPELESNGTFSIFISF